MILVTTAGKVGAEAARLLTKREVPVRVLVRDPEKAKALAAAGAEIAVGDLDVLPSLDAAMADVATVVLVSPAVPAQELNVIASAAQAGVGNVIKATSKASSDSPIARRRWQAEIEAGLAASGLAYTLLRSNAYMQNVLALAPAIARTSGFGSSAGKGPAVMVDARGAPVEAAWRGSPMTCRPSSAGRLARSGSSPPTTPRRSPESPPWDVGRAIWARPAPERAEAKMPVCGCRRASPPLPRPCRGPRRSCAVAAARAGC